MFLLGFDSPNILFRFWGIQDPICNNVSLDPTKQCTCHMTFKSDERFKQGHECARQTDHAADKCVEIGGIA